MLTTYRKTQNNSLIELYYELCCIKQCNDKWKQRLIRSQTALAFTMTSRTWKWPRDQLRPFFQTRVGGKQVIRVAFNSRRKKKHHDPDGVFPKAYQTEQTVGVSILCERNPWTQQAAGGPLQQGKLSYSETRVRRTLVSCAVNKCACRTEVKRFKQRRLMYYWGCNCPFDSVWFSLAWRTCSIGYEFESRIQPHQLFILNSVLC